MKTILSVAFLLSAPAWADAQLTETATGSATMRTIRATAKDDIKPSNWPGFVEVLVSSTPLMRQTLLVNVRNISEVSVSEDGVAVTLGTSPSKAAAVSATTLVVPRGVMDKNAALEMFRRVASER
ncbi:hypothetical protein OPU71_11515 [Niveibacterium sp. 24ML]|uniref:hypothetical protein n=1 Tax=Niveibacterium sp. 24ML TaxID=2985512 RepID=UPI00226E9131|nr:hypothetical protein [Niveibacterium sp. 24ML]MCX9156753.1 hypothetical protein [Niveibacterium sp. 24ML]